MEFATALSMSEREPYSKEMALLALMDRTSYNIVQENGQRRYGPPPNWRGPPPPKGCEVFVGKIPRDLYEDELVPVFERIGMIYEVRLMMDFSGSNRGYAFVMYTNVFDAKRAIEELDNYEIRKNRFIGVCKSIDNCRLFVGGIPKNKTKEEVLREMRRVTADVADVILYSSFQDKTKNRGFAFVEYENHKAAAMARRKLIPGKILLWGQEIAVDWAEPEPEVDENTMLKVTVLYVRNISPTTSEERLRLIFSLKNTLQVEKVKKMRDFGFVHFATRGDAEAALFHLNGICVDGSVLEVTWAKPPDKSCKQRSRSISASASSSYDRSISLPNYADFDGLCNSFSHLSTAGVSARLKTPPPLCWSPPPVSYNRHNGMYSRAPSTSSVNSVNATVDSCKYRTSLNAIQILDEYCQRNNWGDPCYYVQTFEGEPHDCRVLYACKVVIPGLSKYKQFFVPDRITATREDAKLIAAEYILRELGLSIQNTSLWNSTSAVSDLVDSLSYGSRAGTYPKVSMPAQVDLGQGDVGALLSGMPSLTSSLQTSQVSFTKSYDAFDSTRFFELHGLNSN